MRAMTYMRNLTTRRTRYSMSTMNTVTRASTLMKTVTNNSQKKFWWLWYRATRWPFFYIFNYILIMKYTLNDFQWVTRLLDIWHVELRIFDLPFTLTKWNIYAIINTTVNKVMYQVNKPLDFTINSNFIDLSNFDLTDMSDTDEVIVIMDLPIQKTEVNDKNWNIISWNILTKSQEILDANNWILSQEQINYLTLKEIEDLNDAILELTMRLNFLPAVRWQLNDLRVSVLNAVAVTISSWTVTTVTTLSNITSIWWYNMNAMLWALQNNLVANAITNNIIL